MWGTEMQVTTTPRPESNWMITIGMVLAILVAIGLFAVVVSRMGFFSGSVSAESSDLVISAEKMRFGQDEIQLKVGQSVTIVLDNADFYAHSFDQDDQDVHVDMPARKQVTATFTATRPGEFDFYCGVPGHQAAGMVGKIIVTE
jgi:plastocyanin